MVTAVLEQPDWPTSDATLVSARAPDMEAVVLHQEDRPVSNMEDPTLQPSMPSLVADGEQYII